MIEIDYKKLSSKKLEIDKKWQLSYVSWSIVWDTIKKEFNNRVFKIWHTNENGTLWFIDDFGWYAKVTVWIKDDEWNIINENTTWLPIMDNENNPMKKESYSIVSVKTFYDKNKIPADTIDIKEIIWNYWKPVWKVKYNNVVEAINSIDINKTYQRCMVKCIAELTGLWLYVYKWEDLPNNNYDNTKKWKEEQKEQKEIDKIVETTINYKDNWKYKSDLSQKVINEKEFEFSKKKYWLALSREEQKQADEYILENKTLNWEPLLDVMKWNNLPF